MWRIRFEQNDRFRVLLGIKRMDRMLNMQIRDMCRQTNWMNERIDKNTSFLRWFGHIERLRNDRIA